MLGIFLSWICGWDEKIKAVDHRGHRALRFTEEGLEDRKKERDKERDKEKALNHRHKKTES